MPPIFYYFNNIEKINLRNFKLPVDILYVLWYNIYNKTIEVLRMTEKNRKKEEAKKFRNVWHINPITRCKGNDKAYTRKTKHKNKEW